MMLEETGVPRLTFDEAVRLARQRYGLDVSPSPLPSYVDQNFRMEAADGDLYVLKVHHASESPAFVDAQTRALEHVAERTGGDLGVPRVLPTLDGDPVFELDAAGARHLVRLLTWVPGRPVAEIEPVSEDLLTGMGRFLGRLDHALADFAHPGLNRYMRWDLVNVLDAREYLTCLSTTGRPRVAAILDRLEDELLPRFPELRAGVIQGDANDYNLLVDTAVPGPARVTGIIDFGDMVRSRIVCDPAIAMTYMMLGEADPVEAALPVLDGYHREYRLTETEIATLADLIVARLCISVSVSAHEKRKNPDNEYITIQQKAVWTLLERLNEDGTARLTDRFLTLCGNCDA